MFVSRSATRALRPALNGCCLLLLLVVPASRRLGAETTPDASRLAYEGPELLQARVYPRNVQAETPLFTFKRTATRSGSTLRVLREFTYPDGQRTVREHVLYEGFRLVTYELEDLQTGATGTAKVEPDPKHPGNAIIALEYTPKAFARSGSTVKREPFQRDTLVNDMVGPFLAAHWEPLLRGDKVTCRCVVVTRRETVGFTFSKESESKWRGQDVLILKMEPTSLFISALVDPLFFTIGKAPPHRVLQYVGRTTPKIAEGGRWKDLDALTVFDW